jgi:hypothetical protein
MGERDRTAITQLISAKNRRGRGIIYANLAESGLRAGNMKFSTKKTNNE